MVVDVNEFNVTAPVDVNSSLNSVFENSGAGTTVGVTASALDADGSNNAITYSLDDNAGGRFTIDGTTGEITVANPALLDHETDAQHDVVVRATSSDGSSSTATYTLQVLDFNEHDPTIANQAFTVAENSAAGTVVGDVVAIDDDTSQGLTYALTGDSSGGGFAIDPMTGRLTVRDGSLLDFESASTHILEVTVTDDLAPSRSSTATITVDLVDQNEAASIALTNVVDALSEDVDTSTGVRIADIEVVDDAIGTNLLQLTGADAANFEIANGQLRLVAGAVIDFESFTQLDVTIELDDPNLGTAPEDSVSHTLNLIDAADAPVIVPGQVFEVAENSSIGTLLGNIVTSNIGDGLQSEFTILSGNADGVFELVDSAGQIRILDDAELNFEQQGSYVLSLTVSDGTVTSTTEDIRINVLDANDAPVAASDSFSVTQFESLNVFQSSVLANDFDEDVANTIGAELVQGPANGTLEFNADGTFVYTPDPAFFGTDTFTYQTTDGTASSNTATVELVVLPSSDPTVMMEESKNMMEDDVDDMQSEESESVIEDLTSAGSNAIATVSVVEPGVDSAAQQQASSGQSNTVAVIPSLLTSQPTADTAEEEQQQEVEQSLDAVPLSTLLRRSAYNLIQGAGDFNGLGTGVSFAVANIPLGISSQIASASDDANNALFEFEEFVVGTTAITSTSLTVGYVLWMVRGGTLLASFASALPAWTSFDPLQLVQAADQGDGESLANIVENAAN